MSDYQERVARLKQVVDQLPQSPEPEPGSVVWIPCAGVKDSSRGISASKGHVGQIAIAERNSDSKVSWNRTGNWVALQSAQETYGGLIQSSSHGSCPSCIAIIQSSIELEKTAKN